MDLSSYESSDLLIFCHLRWEKSFQRPHHLASRHAKNRRVYYIEDPVWGMSDIPRLHFKGTPEGVQVVVPYLPENLKFEYQGPAMKDLVDELLFEEDISNYVTWYSTPGALSFTRHLTPTTVVFDCLDECPEGLQELETELMRRADLVLTDGPLAYEVKKHVHHNVHHLPSSIDYAHFSQSRLPLVEPDDQMAIPRPRIGYCGPVDHRLDLDLLKAMAEKEPEYQFILLGPIGVDPSHLPERHNIFYLGPKDYHSLPSYLSGWECVMVPLAPQLPGGALTQAVTTPEFLAAGKPVVSSLPSAASSSYGKLGLVRSAFSPEEFLICLQKAIHDRAFDPEWLNKADHGLDQDSWDSTFTLVARLENETLKPRANAWEEVSASPAGLF